ncbi:MAG: response regulator transcription factor [Rhizobacter sp.]|nr:response regulator transcription factor [Chlorobiales bacterium]
MNFAPLKIVIIEDEAPAARRLRKLLAELDAAIQVIAHLSSVEESAQWLVQNPPPDLLLMDIDLSDGLSFDIFSRAPVTSPVIFTTAYSDYAIRAFKVNSIDYLLKPVESAALKAALEKFRTLRPAMAIDEGVAAMLRNLIHQQDSKPQQIYRRRFLIEQRHGLVSIAAADVAYFFSEYKLTSLVTLGGQTHVVPQTLEELETQLEPAHFFRANRQMVVGIKSIAGIDKLFSGKLKLRLTPTAKFAVEVSREKAARFKAWLDQ